jgi:glycosyltransferase involved in cell wall biosynthesis
MTQAERPREARFTRTTAMAMAIEDPRAEGIRVTVVMSTRDQVADLPHVFARLPDGLHEVIVVDLRSTDDTVRVARLLRPDVRIVRHHGGDRAGALARGRAAASGNVVVVVDADGSCDPSDLLHLAGALTGRVG